MTFYVAPLLKYCAMKLYGKVKIETHTFLTLVLNGGGWSASSSDQFTPSEGGWVGPRVVLDVGRGEIPTFAMNWTPAVQPIAIYLTEWAVPVSIHWQVLKFDHWFILPKTSKDS